MASAERRLRSRVRPDGYPGRKYCEFEESGGLRQEERRGNRVVDPVRPASQAGNQRFAAAGYREGGAGRRSARAEDGRGLGRRGLFFRAERHYGRGPDHDLLRGQQPPVHHFPGRLGGNPAVCRHLVGRPDGRRLGVHPFPYSHLHRLRTFRAAQHLFGHGRHFRRQEPAGECP